MSAARTGTAPDSERALYNAAVALAGRSLGELATAHGVAAPRRAVESKGWAGALLERCLGASAGSRPEPDFPALGIELKTLPVTPALLPLESTYVCAVPMQPQPGVDFAASTVAQRLRRVLFVPLVGARGSALPARRVGAPLLWSPDAADLRQLRADWEEIMELIATGQVAALTAHLGELLQVRPKAAHGAVCAPSTGPDGGRAAAQRRGFYLRSSYTARILARHYASAASDTTQAAASRRR